jgi:hypothetical protein
LPSADPSARRLNNKTRFQRGTGNGRLERGLVAGQGAEDARIFNPRGGVGGGSEMAEQKHHQRNQENERNQTNKFYFIAQRKGWRRYGIIYADNAESLKSELVKYDWTPILIKPAPLDAKLYDTTKPIDTTTTAKQD